MVVLKIARATLLAAAASLLAFCKPELGGRASRIEGPRLLAVRSTPAEALPGDAVAYDALYVDQAGELSLATDWAYCSIRKPLDQLDTVDPACLQPSGDGINELGVGLAMTAAMPTDACRNFGPEVPSPKPGQPQGRPVDPDPTGGYYQPLRLLSAAGGDIATTRIACGVAGASASDAADFRARYHFDTNPSIAALTVDGAPASDDPGSPTPVAVGGRVALTVSWPACPTSDLCGDGVCGADESKTSCPADCSTPAGCAGAERYVVYDSAGQRLDVARETMRASWFSTAGSFDSDRTGREGSDTSTDTTDVLALPTTPQSIHGWVVLRDDRGGVAWRRFELASR